MSVHLLTSLARFVEAGRARPIMVLGLDFDGTLAGKTPAPEDAVMSDGMRRAVEALHARPAVTVAVISGRPADEVGRHVGIPGLVYGGSQGYELRGPGFHEVLGTPAWQAALNAQLDLAAVRLQNFPGVRIRKKGPTGAVQYRNVAPERRGETEAIAREVMGALPGAAVSAGWQAIEIRPVDGEHKGTALGRLCRRVHGENWQARVLPVYIGDDETDELAFEWLNGRGVGIRVTDGELAPDTKAPFYLRGVDEVERFLTWLAAAPASGGG